MITRLLHRHHEFLIYRAVSDWGFLFFFFCWAYQPKCAVLIKNVIISRRLCILQRQKIRQSIWCCFTFCTQTERAVVMSNWNWFPCRADQNVNQTPFLNMGATQMSVAHATFPFIHIQRNCSKSFWSQMFNIILFMICLLYCDMWKIAWHVHFYKATAREAFINTSTEYSCVCTCECAKLMNVVSLCMQIYGPQYALKIPCAWFVETAYVRPTICDERIKSYSPPSPCSGWRECFVHSGTPTIVRLQVVKNAAGGQL